MAERMKTRNQLLRNMALTLALILAVPLMGIPVQAGPRQVIGEPKVVETFRDNPYFNYPKAFSGRGLLNERYSDGLVISDTLYKMSSDFSCNIQGQNDVSEELLEKGQAVAFILNEQGEISSLWRLSKLDDLIER